MVLSRPFIVNLYWGGNLQYENGRVQYDESTRRSSIVFTDKLNYEDFLELVYRYVGVTKEQYQLKLYLCFEFQGISNVSEILGDESLETLYFVAGLQENYWGNIFVKMEYLVPPPQHTGFVKMLRNFTITEASTVPLGIHQEGSMQYQQFDVTGASTSTLHIDDYAEPVMSGGHENEDGGFDRSDESGSEGSEETRDEFYDSGEEEDSDDDDDEEGAHAEQHTSPSLHNFSQWDTQPDTEVDYSGPVFDDEEEMDFWSEGSSNEIRVGMYFSNKEELVYAIRRWHISQNRELVVVESTPALWRAVCYTRNKRNNTENPLSNTPPCKWCVRAIKKKKQHLWQIRRWVAAHNCYGIVVGNNNRSLKSSIIASHIMHSIRADIAYSVKQIQTDVKNNMNVDISYSKGWRARKKAIENIYGSWESNFEELPRYIGALMSSNPNTVVQWLHHPNSSSTACTFKYVFWAFGPAIEAFNHCIPVVCVDGTHLKGSYKGKLLTAVTKDANNNILPLAYAIVDDETVESWTWFFEQLRWYVASNSDRQLCVISDRHNGVINAMNHLEDWKEPIAYHRFCLRHIRSNFQKRFKDYRLKKLCWAMGCTTQRRKYREALREMKATNTAAWDYLKEIGTSKWSLLHDTNHRRWGNLTTNIAESLNNVLRGARLLPIKALIDFTFNRTVQHFRKHREIAVSCETPLPPRMWRLFNLRDQYAQQHDITEFDYTSGVYRVVSRLQTNDVGGNHYTVEYGKRQCTCGKWQMHRFPCSHGIAVCRHRGENPHTLVNKVYTTSTYKRQYRSDFFPLPHVAYWNDPGWKIRPNASRLSTCRGRRQGRRIRNEMDVRDPNEPIIRRCGLCKQTGHNRTTCPNSHP